MSRKTARDNAFKLVFEAPFYKNDFETVMNTFDGIEKENLTENDLKYIKSTVSGVFDKLETIDEKINSKLIGWTVGRLPKTTAAILRLAVYEMEFNDDIPVQVAMNEAIELAKIYCDDDAPRFVNGVLESVKKLKEA